MIDTLRLTAEQALGMLERKEGSFVGPSRGQRYRLLDLPGAYSLTPTTLDEAITRDCLPGRPMRPTARPRWPISQSRFRTPNGWPRAGCRAMDSPAQSAGAGSTTALPI